MYITRIISAVVCFPEFDHLRQDPAEYTPTVIEKLFWAASQSSSRPTNIGSDSTSQVPLLAPTTRSPNVDAHFAARAHRGRSRSPGQNRYTQPFNRSRSPSPHYNRDRRRPYYNRDQYRGRSRSPGSYNRSQNYAPANHSAPYPVCADPDCCASNHTDAERIAAAQREFRQNRFLDRLDEATAHYGDDSRARRPNTQGGKFLISNMQEHLEAATKVDNDDDENAQQLDLKRDDNEHAEAFFANACNYATYSHICSSPPPDPYLDVHTHSSHERICHPQQTSLNMVVPDGSKAHTSILSDLLVKSRYAASFFHGIVIVSGFSFASVSGLSQYRAYRK